MDRSSAVAEVASKLGEDSAFDASLFDASLFVASRFVSSLFVASLFHVRAARGAGPVSAMTVKTVRKANSRLM